MAPAYGHHLIGRTAGFALPTILIVSVVMLTVLVGAVASVASLRVSLNEQLYTKLASEASEAGYVRATDCMKQSNGVVTWSDSKPLLPNSDCSGTITTACPASSRDPACYVLMGDQQTTSFSIGLATAQAGAYAFASSGSVNLNRAGGATYKTYRATLGASMGMGMKQAQYVSSGYLQVCAVFDGRTWCWGDNSQGQLGVGKAVDERVMIPARVHRLAGGLLGKSDKIVSVGTYTACVVTQGNEIYCWGRNSDGQLGDGTTVARYSPVRVQEPVEMAGKVISNIVLGERHTCALAEGDVWCWGRNDVGQLGVGDTTRSLTPLRVNVIGVGNNPALAIASLDSSTWSDTSCAIATGKVYCWGRNDRGQMGDGTATNRTSPTAVSTTGSSSLVGRTLKKVVVTGGFVQNAPSDPLRRGHVCVLDTMNEMHCWGSDQYGQVGTGSIPASPNITPYPTKVAGVLAGKEIADIAVSFGTSCALVADTNDLYCWGANYGGQLGDGTKTGRVTPTLVKRLTPGLQGKAIESISGGANRNCALADSAQYCWGVNASAGQIGDGTLIDRTTPTEATMLHQLVPMLYY